VLENTRLGIGPGAPSAITPYVSRGYAILHSSDFISSHQELKQSLQYPANVRDHSQPHSLHLSFPSVAESRIRGKMRDITLAGGFLSFMLSVATGGGPKTIARTIQRDLVVVLVCVVVLRRGRRGEVPDHDHERQNTQGNVDDQGQPQRELLVFHVSGYRVWGLGIKPCFPFRGSFPGSARSLSPTLQPTAGYSIGHTAWLSSHG
jgi:hypothetical protein